MTSRLKLSSVLLGAGVAAVTAALTTRWTMAQRLRWRWVRQQRGTTALITGASSGLGEMFAHRLAAAGYHLILVARRADRLQTLARALTQHHQIYAEALPADLSKPDDVARVVARLSTQPDLSLLINNAGFGLTGAFARNAIEPQLDMVQVHIETTMRLCRAALPTFFARGVGGIINVSSIMAFLPLPGTVTYAATKAYLNRFSETLQVEVQRQGVVVQALCPGYTHTEFHATPDLRHFKKSDWPAWMWTNADVVVEESLATLGNGDVLCIPGVLNQALVGLVQVPGLADLFKASPLFKAAARRRLLPPAETAPQ